MTRHGRVARTPVSPADPGVLPTVHPGNGSARYVGRAERTLATRRQLADLAQVFLDEPSWVQRSRHNLALARILDWLESFPGEDWQDRWLLSGADNLGNGWGPAGLSPAHRSKLTLGLRMLIALRAVRPSYPWLSASRQLGMYALFRRHNQVEAFTELEERAVRHGRDEHAAEALNLLTRMVIVTGQNLRELDLADFDHYTAARRTSGHKAAALPLAYQLLHEIGAMASRPPTLRQATARGPMSVTELVDRYPIANQQVRAVLVHYLLERSAALDYGSLVNQAQTLVSLFWVDLERHHPGISSLDLPADVVQAWKQRVRTCPDGTKRRGVHMVFFAVRAFYLDLQQWALEDPAKWAPWAAPCPIGDADVRGYIKETRQRQARMQQRTRALIPVLPRLVTAAEDSLREAQGLLEAVRALPRGGELEFAGRRYWRAGREDRTWRPTALLVIPLDPPGPRFDAERREDNAFWTWAAIEVLRRTGARIEELLELTHLSLRQYHAPTGETVPLLQISPSKTDRERVIPADPDLVAVLARIIRRIKNTEGKVPLLARYDTHERVFGLPLPHLFQRLSHHLLEVIGPNHVRDQLTTLAAQAAIVDIDGSPLRFTPHDFRRIFSTETVNGGLPIHIAAKVLGHLDLNVTQGYVAVYPEEVIGHYRRFIDARRAHRPGEEYREPSDTEWTEFRDHFALRKVALGSCDRPYGTPCQHEHACVRCPMLRLDLAQVPRLLEIEDNTRERLTEATEMKWLGEVVALEESLRHIAAKKQQAERLMERGEMNNAGLD